MCGRYTNTAEPRAIELRFGVRLASGEGTRRYNVAPTEPVLALVGGPAAAAAPGSAAPVARVLRWGLIPPWAKDGKAAYKMINARSETAETKPAYRRLIASAGRRALLPADGFYEWLRSEDRRQPRQPFRFTVDGGAPFALAGLWTPGWLDGEEVATVTILTCPANDVVGRLHDRMPVILPDLASELAWLDPRLDGAAARAMCQPLPGTRMQALAANPAVNRTGKDLPEGPELLSPPATPAPTPTPERLPGL